MPTLQQLYTKPVSTFNPLGAFAQVAQTITYVEDGISTMDNSTNNTFTLVADGTGTTIAHSNVSLTGNRYGFELHLDWVSGTITWPASWSKGMNPPSDTGDYVIQGFTIDGGISWTINIIYQ